MQRDVGPKKSAARCITSGLFWSDLDAALKKYLDQRDDLQAGRTPRVTGEGPAVKDLVNRFLTVKKHVADTLEIAPRTFTDYHDTCASLVEAFGRQRLVSDLAADDFESLRSVPAKTRGPVAWGNEISRVRTVFKCGYDAGLIDVPVRVGPSFKRPNRRVLRQARQAKGPRMFEANDLRKIIAAANGQLKAPSLNVTVPVEMPLAGGVAATVATVRAAFGYALIVELLFSH